MRFKGALSGKPNGDSLPVITRKRSLLGNAVFLNPINPAQHQNTYHQISMVTGHNNDTYLTVYAGTQLLLQVKSMASRPGHCGVGISAKCNIYSLASFFVPS